MTNAMQQAAQIAGNAARFGWYFGINQLLGRQAQRLGRKPAFRPTLPVPSRQELLGDLTKVFLADAAAVRAGIYPPTGEEYGSLADHLTRLRSMMADLPDAMERRQSADTATARQVPQAGNMPDYFTQDFHFQTGGYLTEASARLYDVQVETLFYGSANVMRRAALRPIAEFARGRDQRKLALLDVACGTGRLLRQIRLAYPAMKLTGLDLSEPYLGEARRHMGDLRPATLIAGNGEALPFADESFDTVTNVFLFHELPAPVRRRVTGEFARVLKPGGLMVFIDSLQLRDRPDWDGLLEAFPHRFHEPYYENYIADDLDRLFTDAGLVAESAAPIFLSKLMVRRKL